MALVGCACAFLLKFFGPVSVDQILFHVQAGGMDHADPNLLRRAARYALAALLITGLAATLVHRSRARVGYLLLVASTASATVLVDRTLSDGCPGVADEGYIDEHYVRPTSLVAPARPPDILIVFVESLEESYRDTSVFGRNLIPGLDRWRSSAGMFGDFHGLQGASWTIAGVFATLCGLPLKPVGLQTGNHYEFGSRFFSAGLCLTDLLRQEGYTPAFYKGASLKFAGFEQFLGQHAVTDRFGFDELVARNPAARRENDWGLNDGTLLDIALADVAHRRGDRKGPFLDMVLTVNTHPPVGVVEARCDEATGAAGRPDSATRRAAYACTDTLVTGFLDRVASLGDGRERLVVVLGDHLAMRSAHDPELLRRDGERRVFLGMRRIAADGRQTPLAPAEPRAFTHLDLLPTILAAAGYRWPGGDRLALGTSLLGDRTGSPTLAERDGVARLESALACRSRLFEALW